MHYGLSTKIINNNNSKGKEIPIECPKSTVDYNTFMGRVDQ